MPKGNHHPSDAARTGQTGREQLHEQKNELERKAHERTAELREANASLWKEINSRRDLEKRQQMVLVINSIISSIAITIIISSIIIEREQQLIAVSERT